MEQMPYYLPPEEDWKKHFEGLIPILILILIAVVLVGKTTNFFCAVPGLSDVFCAKGDVMVGLLGDFSNTAQTEIKADIFKAVLDEEGAKFKIYSTLVPLTVLEFAQADPLRGVDILAVAGFQNLSYSARVALGKYIANGGKVIWIGDAGVFSESDPLMVGWGAAEYGDYTPVRLASKGAPGDLPRELLDSPQLNYFNRDHPIIKDYTDTYRLNFSRINSNPSCQQINALKVNARDGSTTVAVLSSGDEKKTVLAIVEKQAGALGNGGNVIYFNYDPGCTNFATIATLRYLGGKY